MVATDDSVYTGFGFEGMNAAARPEFMRRVHGAPRRDGQARRRSRQPGQPGDRAPGRGPKGKVRIKSKRKLRLDRKGRVAVRLDVRG